MGYPRSAYADILKRQSQQPLIKKAKKRVSEFEELVYKRLIAAGIEPVREHKFHPDRKWRFDFSWPDKKIAVECEGGCWVQGRHSRGKGFEADCVKYNQAVLHGWRVLRFTKSQIDDIVPWVKLIIV